MSEVKTGVELIAAERQRQINSEGWTEEHDDEHAMGELSQAASAYAKVGSAVIRGVHMMYAEGEWPWQREWWKPSDDPIRNLVKAGALIAAEIDRLTRKAGLHRRII